MESLYQLRRVGCGLEEASCDEEPDEPLMRECLKDVEDTEESLRRLEDTLLGSREPIHDQGGARHATTLISGLRIERAQASSEQILREMVDSASPAPRELLSVHKFVHGKTHKNGNPEDENKSDFQAFATSFGLPAAHRALARLLDLGARATAWWAEAALKEAQAGTDTLAVHRLLSLAADILGQPDHEAIVRCRKALGDALAENALRSAQALLDQDATLVRHSPKAQPESARRCSDAINQEIRTAVSMGAPPSHQSLSQAKKIATDLVMEEKDRLAARVLEFARAQQERDSAIAERCRGPPPVGPAVQAAEAIEREAKGVVGKGVLETHPVLQEALKVAKALRDEDGTRKRLAARERRLSGQAA